MQALTQRQRYILLVTSLIALGIGLLAAVALYNFQARKRFSHVEVTFVAPQQAVIFWKTAAPSVGYVKYGATARSRGSRADQTSSEPSEVHAVMLDQLPPEGVYVSLHDNNENILTFPEVRHIQFQQAEAAEGGL